MRRAISLTILSTLLCGLVAVAVAQQGGSRDPTLPGESPAEAPAATPRSAEDLARRAGVVARVGDATVTVGEVEDAINEQSPFVRVRYRDPEQLRLFAETLVRFELFGRAAERAGFADDPEVTHVVQQNSVQQLIRRDFDERITVDGVPQADVQAYYDTHPEEFGRGELRRAAHIRLRTRDEAERLLTKARTADAREFRDLAREHSTDPETNLRGGDLRYFDEEGHARNPRDAAVDSTLATAAFALGEVGDVAAAPIAVGDQWSLLKLTGRRPAELRSVEQAGPTIRLRIWRQSRQEALESFVARLRTEAGVDPINYDLLRAIRLDPPEREDEEEAPPGAPPPAPFEAVQPVAPDIDEE